MKAYINAIEAISPQPTFDGSLFEVGMKEYEQPRLNCLEPDYKLYINPSKLRRMPRILKMGLTAASRCISERLNPDAVIVGTGLGCVSDLEKFQMAVRDSEHLLSPSPFVNSSHNMISSQIAIAFGINGYNMTHFHGSLSFENAILDAMMLINEGSAKNVLVGGIDEITDQHFHIADNNNYWRKSHSNNKYLFEGSHTGTLMGEGAVFLMLGAEPTDDNAVKITGTHTITDKKNNSHKILNDCLKTVKCSQNDIDTLILGCNGDAENDRLYEDVKNGLNQTNILYYKHLCGEYNTSTAFATWLAANILKKQNIPDFVINRKYSNSMSKLAIFNHSRGTEYGFLLLEK